jgi:hypothetical protein
MEEKESFERRRKKALKGGERKLLKEEKESFEPRRKKALKGGERKL